MSMQPTSLNNLQVSLVSLIDPPTHCCCNAHFFYISPPLRFKPRSRTLYCSPIPSLPPYAPRFGIGQDWFVVP